MSVAIVTGSAGLVGSAVVELLCLKGWSVLGIDNDQRGVFFGPDASTSRTSQRLCERHARYAHHDADIRDEAATERLFADHGSNVTLVVHAAAQPSHDWAAGAPLVDFHVNATATLQLLEQTRAHAPEAVFAFISTNKVYGDTPNALPLLEQDMRWELDATHPYAARGIDESMSVDQNLHSLFGCSKLSADLMVQEYGRYFGLKTACFRCSCITGGAHAGVELHGFLAYLMRCAVDRRPYVIYGYKGKQVRDNLHADDLAAAIWAFYENPRCGEVYNMGGGRGNDCSVLEAIKLCEAASGNALAVRWEDGARRGDHQWWVSDVSRFQAHYPQWRQRHDLPAVIADLYGAVSGGG